MDRATFEAELASGGYDIRYVSMKPNAVNPTHQHEFDARLLVVEGSMTIERDGAETRTYSAGETFEMPNGTRHSETAGAEGATYVAGRRMPTRH